MVNRAAICGEDDEADDLGDDFQICECTSTKPGLREGI